MEFVIGIICGVCLTLAMTYIIHWCNKTNKMIEDIQEDNINKTARINQLQEELTKYKNIIDNK